MSSSPHKLCISILPDSKELLKQQLAACQDADIIEIRLDHLPTASMSAICKESEKPVMVTLRSKTEGGYWEGDATETAKFLQSAIKAGAAYVDVEFAMADRILPVLKKKDGVEIILSHHTTESSLQALTDILDRMRAIPADIYKLIFEATSQVDSRTALELIAHARAAGIRYVIHAMGPFGESSRLLGAQNGNALTYVAADFAESTAAGQFTLNAAANFYRLRQKSPDARILGLMGNPVQQSKGWRLHNTLIENRIAEPSAELNRKNDFLYINFLVNEVAPFWTAWKDRLHGLSVTSPYKEQVLEFLDEQAPEVRISGVCNTIVREKNGWVGYNTDLLAIEALLRGHRDVIRKGGMIIGTGATARSAIAALKRLDVNPLFVVGRNEERGKMLMNAYGIDYLREDEVHYASAGVIIQTTPVGMVPYTDQYPLGTSLFRKERVVLDVIYNPVETRFLKIARDRGCKTISGVEMFLRQAARQFELFTGENVGIEEIRTVWQEIV